MDSIETESRRKSLTAERASTLVITQGSLRRGIHEAMPSGQPAMNGAENADGEWITFFVAGDAAGAKPIAPW